MTISIVINLLCDFTRLHHQEGVLYRSFCFHSSTFAAAEIASGRWWCIESLFPGKHNMIMISIVNNNNNITTTTTTTITSNTHDNNQHNNDNKPTDKSLLPDLVI